MNLDWLTKDDFLQKELVKFVLSLSAALILLWVGRGILFRRDRKIQELDRNRHLLDEMRNEFVQIFNEYYKVRKRYAIIREVLNKDTSRNPYIGEIQGRDKETLDDLLVTCISLEARYYSLMQRLRISFYEFWRKELRVLMERKNREDEAGDENIKSIEFCFDTVRDYIEQQKVIDRKLKVALQRKFREILKKFNEQERNFLVYPSNRNKAA